MEVASLSQQIGFIGSWKRLTREGGWWKPVCVLALVGWIPILGQIALLGYAFEWARMAAWGSDASPKAKGHDYSKVLKTGGIGFLVTVSMVLVLAVFDMLVFGDFLMATAFPAGAGSLAPSVLEVVRRGTFDLLGGGSFAKTLLLLVVNVFAGQIIMASVMRATIYDSFAAGWRVDRVLQMIGRDLGGFLHTYAISLIGGIIVWIYASIVSLLCTLVVFGGVMGTMVISGNDVLAMGDGGLSGAIVQVLLNLGPSTILLLLLVAAGLAYVGNVISVIAELVSIHSIGRWFSRFDVERWGVSSAPLPDGVPSIESNGGSPVAGQ